MKQTLCIWFIVAAVGLGGCGRSPRNVTKPPVTPIKVPKLLLLEGGWTTLPSLQMRAVGQSRLVQLVGEVVPSQDPLITGLAQGMYLADHDGIDWLAPALDGCELTQRQVQMKTEVPYRLEIQLWGWEREGGAAVCEALLRRIQVEGFQLRLRKVPVKASPAVPEVLVKVGPVTP